MLQTLSIQNLALIEKLSIDFQTGFTSLTGETGAGKSILLDALGLTLGNRADSSLVRHGTARADITADFEISNLNTVQQWLAEHELDDDNQCLLRRTLTAEGRSKAYINGLPASVSQLKTLSGLLIDIHGQHEHQSLLKADKQLELLDLFAQHVDLLEKVKNSYQLWQQKQKSYDEFLALQSDRLSKIELLAFQKNELDELSPLEGEFDNLSQEQQTLAHASEILTATQTAYQSLESEQGATNALSTAISQIETIVEFQPEMEAILQQLNSVLIDAQEIASDLQTQANYIELDPERLNQVDERLSTLYGMAKKYHLEPDQLFQKHQEVSEQLNALLAQDNSAESLAEEVKTLASDFQKQAKQLSASRQKAAKKLGKMVTEAMHTLGMPNGIFEIQFAEVAASKHGLDTVTLMVTTNKGQPVQALSKVASGGELSRISLAIQVASAEVASLPTMIFDEVDVGIGGGIAEVVGQKMHEIGQHRQVFAITHLPQVASFGQTHLFINKNSEGKQTTTDVQALDQSQRINEIARMLGGMEITEQTLKHAAEMLEKS